MSVMDGRVPADTIPAMTSATTPTPPPTAGASMPSPQAAVPATRERRRNRGDPVYRWMLTALALCLPLLLVSVAGQLVVDAGPSLRRVGVALLWETNLGPGGGGDGGGALVFRPAVSSFVALRIAV